MLIPAIAGVAHREDWSRGERASGNPNELYCSPQADSSDYSPDGDIARGHPEYFRNRGI